MTQERSNRSLIVVPAATVALIALAIAWWSLREHAEPRPSDTPEAMPAAEPAPEPEPAPTGGEEMGASGPGAPAPRAMIGESGRLSVTREQLMEDGVAVLGLALPDVQRGDAGLSVKIIDARGRVIDVEGAPIRGTDAGLRLEVDPEWLEPGHYMIQLKTVEQKPLSLRRYVLEVQRSPSDPPDQGLDAPAPAQSGPPASE